MTTPPHNSSTATTRSTVRWLGVQAACLSSIALCAMVWSVTGCRTRLVVLPADRTISFLPKGEIYRATNDTYLVPPALMRDITRLLNRTNTP